jgi:hypothetical protein
MAQGRTIPPFLLEIFLRSGKSYFIKNVFEPFDASALFPIRVWDLRGLYNDDYAEMLAVLNGETIGDLDWDDYRKILPKLEEGNLWLRIEEVEHVMEWHDRGWATTEATADAQPAPIGFRRPGSY